MYRLDRNSLEIIYKSFIQPTLEYGDIIMSNMTDEQSQLIEHVNKRAGCIISGAIRGTSSNVLFEELSWVSMETRRKHHRIYAFHKIVFNLSPPYLRNCIPSYGHDISSYQFRDADALQTISCRLDLFYTSFFPLAVRE